LQTSENYRINSDLLFATGAFVGTRETFGFEISVIQNEAGAHITSVLIAFGKFSSPGWELVPNLQNALATPALSPSSALRENRQTKSCMNVNTTATNRTCKEWKTKREIAAHYKCDIRTITKYMRRGILPFIKIARFVRFDVNDCDRAMEKYRSKTIFEE
jgi:hypothetical protein